jgi:hypothetical protein
MVYVCAMLAGQPVDTIPLTCTEQASINTCFAREKQYFLLMHNTEQACFIALDASVNDVFKRSNNPAIQGWHCNDHQYVCRENGQPHTLMGHLHGGPNSYKYYS